MNNSSFKDIYNNYFNIDTIIPEEIGVFEPSDYSRPRINSNGNIDTVDKFCDLLRIVLNSAWGSDWGVLSPSTSRGDDPSNVELTQINYSTNLREASKGFSSKYALMDNVEEIVNGQPTGEMLRVYRQFFDCIVEFDFITKTSSDSENLMINFEEVITTYSGYLKSAGVSDVMFLKEVPAQYSFNYNKKLPMKCLYYYVRLERNKTVKASKIKDIEKIIIDTLEN